MVAVVVGMLARLKDGRDNPMGTGGGAAGSNAIAGQYLPMRLTSHKKKTDKYFKMKKH